MHEQRLRFPGRNDAAEEKAMGKKRPNAKALKRPASSRGGKAMRGGHRK